MPHSRPRPRRRDPLAASLAKATTAPLTPVPDDEQKKVEGRLGRLMADPLFMERRDKEFQGHVKRQFDRVFTTGPVERDATGRMKPPRAFTTALEPFRPKVRREDAAPKAPVGAGGRNSFEDVLGLKKALARTGDMTLEFDDEPSNKAGPRFLGAIRGLQKRLGVLVDGKVNPGGPTARGLLAELFPPAAAKERKEKEEKEKARENDGPFGSRLMPVRPGDPKPELRNLPVDPEKHPKSELQLLDAKGGGGGADSGAGGASGSKPGGPQQVATHYLSPPRIPKIPRSNPGGKGGGGKIRPGDVAKEIGRQIDKVPTPRPETKQPKPSRPATIVKFEDGRIYLPLNPDNGQPDTAASGDKLDIVTDVAFAREFIDGNLPPETEESLDDTQSGKAAKQKIKTSSSSSSPTRTARRA